MSSSLYRRFKVVSFTRKKKEVGANVVEQRYFTLLLLALIRSVAE